MNLKSLSLSLVLLAFGALSTYTLLDVGYLGLIQFHLTSSAGWQVITDLTIVCTLAILWMIHDAKQSGRNAWPYVLVTLFAGSFGPLLYLLIGQFAGVHHKAEFG